MTWEQTIEHIRNLPGNQGLITSAYLDKDLNKNVQLFHHSEEYKETLKIIKHYAPNATQMLDIGCGNGISTISFAIDGYQVTALEPDASNTVGLGAVLWLKELHNLSNIALLNEYAESISLPDASVDIVYCRQSMHHAANLQQFISAASRVLKPGGLFITIRDHVIFDEADKEWFLNTHPLHALYGGENAFTHQEYTVSMENAGLQVVKTLHYFDSVINYFPIASNDVRNLLRVRLLGKFSPLRRLGKLIDAHYSEKKKQDALLSMERNFAGRMYSYICLKPI